MDFEKLAEIVKALESCNEEELRAVTKKLKEIKKARKATAVEEEA